MIKRVGIYLRVSTNGQTTENQRRELRARNKIKESRVAQQSRKRILEM
jgi:DNA invertase Pin-like site-specific DNA recombinase